MTARQRRTALLAVAIALGLLVGCSSAQSGNGSGTEVTASDTSTSDIAATEVSAPVQTTSVGPPSRVSAPTTHATATAPHVLSSTNKANPGAFGGQWQGSDSKTLDISGDESANLAYMVGVLCSSATPSPSPCDDDKGSPVIPGGQLKLHITMVVTTGDTAVATALVKNSSDPKHPEGSTILFTLKDGAITSPVGAFTKV